MKKILSLILSCIILLVAASCTSEKEKNTELDEIKNQVTTNASKKAAMFSVTDSAKKALEILEKRDFKV